MIPHVDDSTQIDEEIPYDYGKGTKVGWHHHLLLNRLLKVFIALLFTSVLAPLLIYYYLFFSSMDLPPADGYSTGSCLLPREARLMCGIGAMNSTECHSSCCYDYNSNLCFHRLPSRFSYIMDREWTEELILYPRVPSVPYKGQSSIPTLRMSINEVSSSHLSITFYNPQEVAKEGRRIWEKKYDYKIFSPELNIVVNRTAGDTIFNTIRGPLIASNNIWEIAFKLTEETMYGLGEIPLKENTVKVLYNHDGGLSSIPLIFARSNGSYHGVLIDMIEPTEVRIEGENNIVIRSIATAGIKLHIFVGPQPKDVMRDVMNLIGARKTLQYWMLGAHVCNDVSDDPSDAYNSLNEFLKNAASENLPYDSHCGTKPIVFEDDLCTEEKDYVVDGVKLVTARNKRFVPHVSPFIRHEKNNDTEEIGDENSTNEDGEENHTEYDNSTETITEPTVYCTIAEEFFESIILDSKAKKVYVGEINKDTVIYPDYSAVTGDFMNKVWKYNVKLDGVILQNSWPLDESFKFNNETNYILPYFNNNFGEAFNITPQWNTTMASGEKYIYSHNEYGNNFARAFKHVLVGETPIWSSSQRMNSDLVVNRQNINASWTNLQKELVEAALGGATGQWLWASPICGDTEYYDNSTQAALCVKWYMAATYLPMIKIHSKTVLRHPLSFVGINKMYMMEALKTRLSMLPYFFTTLQDGPLLRPMFFQFPSSDKLKDLKSQFSVGDNLLIVPNLQPSQTHVHVWMPPGTWFELWSGLRLEGEEGDAVTMTTTEADFLTLIRGGSILIMQKDVKSTAEETRRQSSFTLTVALECKSINTTEKNIVNSTECHANGTLYISNDMSIVFEANFTTLTITATGIDFTPFCDTGKAIWARLVKDINIYGLDGEINNYDHHRHVTAGLDLCELVNNETVEFTFIPT